MYTWIKKEGPQRSRLDLFLTSNSLKPYITNLNKYPAYKFDDHNPITLTIDYSNFKQGKGYWIHDELS